MKMKRYVTFDDFFAGQPPTNRSILRALRKFVAREAPLLGESIKCGNSLKGDAHNFSVVKYVCVAISYCVEAERGGTSMLTGVYCFPTDYGIDIAEASAVSLSDGLILEVTTVLQRA